MCVNLPQGTTIGNIMAADALAPNWCQGISNHDGDHL